LWKRNCRIFFATAVRLPPTNFPAESYDLLLTNAHETAELILGFNDWNLLENSSATASGLKRHQAAIRIKHTLPLPSASTLDLPTPLFYSSFIFSQSLKHIFPIWKVNLGIQISLMFRSSTRSNSILRATG
jgi:hypothetical protein